MFCRGLERDAGLSVSRRFKGTVEGTESPPKGDERLVLPVIPEAAVQPLEVGAEGRIGRQVPELSQL